MTIVDRSWWTGVSLEEYQRKRNFNISPEPRGSIAGDGERLYCMQKHAARLLHYDLRLALDGVLLSWAIQDGPSLDPGQRRLAVHTEDHPLEYGSFEGVIPLGQYGGGTVMLWDTGAWSPVGDPHTGYRSGRIEFELVGTKLRGRWIIERQSNSTGNKDNWTLSKLRDEHARDENKYCICDEQPYSVTSLRSMEEIAQCADLVWSDGQARAREGAVSTHPLRSPAGFNEPTWANKVSRMPRIRQLQPRAQSRVPDCDNWIHEIEHAGLRVLAVAEQGQVRILDQQKNDHSDILPEVSRAIARVSADRMVLDGVVTVLDSNGCSSKSALSRAMSSGKTGQVVYFVFDLLLYGEYDLRSGPLLGRKEILEWLLEAHVHSHGVLRYADHIVGQGRQVYEQACKLGASGIVSKRHDAPYDPHKADWRHISCDTSRTRKRTRDDNLSPAVVVEPGFFIHGVRLSNPNRILYPEQRITKQVLATYYERVATLLLPHITSRPLSLYRCPKGYERKSFFQKNLDDINDRSLQEQLLGIDKKSNQHITVSGMSGLMTLVQLSTLEIHPWASRLDNLQNPDRMILDLDPGSDVAWQQVSQCALRLNEILTQVGLRGYLKTSGGKGLHIIVPITRRHSWEVVKAFSEAIARQLVRQYPREYTSNMSKSKRAGKIFIDYFRNHHGSTCVAPYSTRARPGAPVSMPIDWSDLGEREPRFTVQSVLGKQDVSMSDPWLSFSSCRQSITKEKRRALGMDD